MSERGGGSIGLATTVVAADAGTPARSCHVDRLRPRGAGTTAAIGARMHLRNLLLAAPALVAALPACAVDDGADADLADLADLVGPPDDGAPGDRVVRLDPAAFGGQGGLVYTCALEAGCRPQLAIELAGADATRRLAARAGAAPSAVRAEVLDFTLLSESSAWGRVRHLDGRLHVAGRREASGEVVVTDLGTLELNQDSEQPGRSGRAIRLDEPVPTGARVVLWLGLIGPAAYGPTDVRVSLSDD
jgi:hypothetical protein